LAIRLDRRESGQLANRKLARSIAYGLWVTVSSIPRWFTAGLLFAAGVTAWITFETSWITATSEFVSRESPLLVAIGVGQVLLTNLGYPGLVIVVFVENVFPPIPSDIILPLAGYTAATTTMTLFGAILATTGGSLIGAMTL
jgi:hypothetical protein